MKLPNVLERRNSKIVNAIFWHLFYHSDDQGFFELDASTVANQTGYSERKVYYVIAYLKKCALLDKKITRLGRGKHSLYRLRWKKVKESQKSSFSKEVCTDIVDNKNLKHLKGDHPQQRQVHRDERVRRFKIFHFRVFLEKDTFLSANEARMCIQLLAKHIQGKSMDYLRHLWEYLQRNRLAIGTPKWCWAEPKKTYAWFGWILKTAEKKYVHYGKTSDLKLAKH